MNKKIYQSLVVLSAVVVMSIALTANVAAQQTYEMRCRGGRFLSLTTPSVPWGIDATGKGMVVMTLKFAGGPQQSKIGSDGTRLNPGQCSWVDRDLRAGEPTEIRFDLLKNSFDRQKYAVCFCQPGSKDSINRVNYATELYPDAESLPGYLVSPNHYWSFRVYNTGKGYLQATSSHAFKPAARRAGPDVLR